MVNYSSINTRKLYIIQDDRSDGGLITTLIEMCISSHYGANINVNSAQNKESYLFNEQLGLVLEVSPKNIIMY